MKTVDATKLKQHLTGLLRDHRRGSPAALKRIHKVADRFMGSKVSDPVRSVLLGALAAAFVAGVVRR